jgi:hypothetical protein
MPFAEDMDSSETAYVRELVHDVHDAGQNAKAFCDIAFELTDKDMSVENHVWVIEKLQTLERR